MMYYARNSIHSDSVPQEAPKNNLSGLLETVDRLTRSCYRGAYMSLDPIEFNDDMTIIIAMNE